MKIGKLSNKGNIIKERWELMVKSEVNIVRNLQLRTFLNELRLSTSFQGNYLKHERGSRNT